MTMLKQFSKLWTGLLLVAALLLVRQTFAAAVSVDLDVQPRVLQLGEAAQATVTVHGERNPPPPPLGGLPDCDVSGPSVNSQVSIINGRMDQSVTFVYQLVPRRTGALKIGPINYKIGNQTLQLRALELTVGAPTATGTSGEKKDTALSDLFFARLDIMPTNLFQNQLFELQLSIFHREIRLDSSFSLLNWQPAGLSISAFRELPAQRVMLNGQVFEARQFRCQARALSAGPVHLAPTVRGALVVQRERQQRGGPFNDPFFDRFFQDSLFNRAETRPVDIPTQPLEFSVRALPENGRPKDFNGAVGQFALTAQVKPDSAAVGDPVTLAARISGHGNFDSIAFPMLGNSELLKTYDAKLTAKELDETQTRGSKTYEQVLIPRSLDAQQIPAVGFNYFDPEKEQYVVLSAGPFDVKLRPAAAGAAPLTAPTQAAATPTGRDIAYLKSAPTHWRIHDEAEWSAPRFWSLQAIPPLAVVVAFILARRRQLRSGDVRWARREQAPRSARRALRTAEQALAMSQWEEFYEALANALRSYFGNRLNLPPGDVTPDGLLHVLQTAQVAAALTERVRALLELCDHARFGQMGSAALDREAGRRTLQEIANLLRNFEKVRL
ncbi:MAG: hypothetical protein EPN23_10645 [Verrucomicrobia bacterium]|nr:MAG: hypothetical protein EPN23_10645 [Verrucomicrobiota bacterium]